MRFFFNPGNEEFQDAVNSEIYVDKTELIEYTIKVLNSAQAFICNSRPRRFGKSFTVNMLTAYYSKGCDSKNLFGKLNISKSDCFKKHLNKYNVIHIDMQWCIHAAKGPENLVAYLSKEVIREMQKEFPDIPLDETGPLYTAILEIYLQTQEKFIVLIDEWDAIIRDEDCSGTVKKEYIQFLGGMFKGAGPAKFIALAYLTGILPIKRMSTQSTLNNFDEYTMLSPKSLAPYIGFTEEEVKALCCKYGRDFNSVKKWYDGYILSTGTMTYAVYNPKAVVNTMLWGEFQSYWSQTGSFESIKPYINRNLDGLKEAVISMLSGDDITVNTTLFQNDVDVIAQKDDVIVYLVHLGYLAYNPIRKTVFVPNEEVRQEFANATQDESWNELLKFEQESKELLNNVLDLEEEKVAAKMEVFHNRYTSVIEYNDENSLSSVLSVAFLGAIQYYFRPVRELPTGRGYADFVYVPKPEYVDVYPALILELKWNHKAETAIQQIKAKNYPDSILHYTGNILLVGISYDKETKVHQCKIEKLKK